MRFLHAYLGLHFRATARPEPPTIALSATISFAYRSLCEPVLKLLRLYIHSASRHGLGETSRFRTLCRNNVTYYTSIKQRELHRSCQLNLLEPY